MNQSPNQQIAKFPVKGLGAIVMAAGLGTRMQSSTAKVLHRVAGRPMVLYALELAQRLAGEGVVVVVGHQGPAVTAVIQAEKGSGVVGAQRPPGPSDQRLLTPSVARPALRSRAKGVTAHVKACGPVPLLVAEQIRQLGTGHAVMQALGAFTRARGGPAPAFLILNGDTPLLREATLRALVRVHQEEKAAVTLLTAVPEDPAGYGRVVRDPKGRVVRIVEDRDATEAEVGLREVNVGTYVVEAGFLIEALDRLQPRNVQREYYLTDIVRLAVERGLPVAALSVDRPEEGLGINSRQQLATAEALVREAIRARVMEAGVTLRDPATTVIEAGVRIGRDTILHPHVTLEGRTTIGEACEIRSGTRITDSILGDRVVVQDSCVIREARLEDDTVVGPFAHLRAGAVVRTRAKVGNFVEMKKAELGEESKANHLSYLGDARIGREVNIGAGTITCNYDGVRKHETVIEDGVFVGSDTQFIAPVKVGRGAVIAAGSTITEDVPSDALAIARATQVTRAGWAARKRALQQAGRPEARGARRAVEPRTSNLKPPTGKAATKRRGGK